jgi:hypothetical protein
MPEKIVEKIAECIPGERLFICAKKEAARKPACISTLEPIWDVDWDNGVDHSHSD